MRKKDKEKRMIPGTIDLSNSAFGKNLISWVSDLLIRVDDLSLMVDDNHVLLQKRLNALCEYLGGDFKVLPAKPEKVVFVVKDKVVDGQKDGS